MTNTAQEINTVAARLKDFDFSDRIKFEELIREIKEELISLEMENLAATNARLASKEKLEAEEAHNFFRSRERMENTKLVIQYLISFTTKIPMVEDLQDDIANPFEQFLNFTNFSIDLLKAPDVISAAIQMDRRLGLINETNIWYYKGKIGQTHKKFRDILKTCKNPTKDDYIKVFTVTRDLCIFWFGFRNQQLKRIRKTDIYKFQLSTYLLYKLQGFKL